MVLDSTLVTTIPESLTRWWSCAQPPYSPEPNPVEKLWDMMQELFCNCRWTLLEELLERATYWLKDFWDEPKNILSLVGDGWIRQQANG